MMTQSEIVFLPLIGSLVWNVHRGVGRYLTMEFGKPHLEVREPLGRTLQTTKRLQRLSRMRRAHVCGDWALFIQGDWKVAVEDDWLHSNDEIVPHSLKEDCLLNLSGQRLVSVEAAEDGRHLGLVFDLTGKLEIWPPAEDDDSQWSLHGWDGHVAAMDHDGKLEFEVAEPRRDAT
jgi:hypothetical protein